MRRTMATLAGATMLAAGVVPALPAAAQAVAGQAPGADAPRPPQGERGPRGPRPGAPGQWQGRPQGAPQAQSPPQVQPQPQFQPAPAQVGGGAPAAPGPQGYRGPRGGGGPEGYQGRGYRGASGDPRAGFDRRGAPPFAGRPDAPGLGTPDRGARADFDPRGGGRDGRPGGYTPGYRGGGQGFGQERPGYPNPGYANPGQPRPAYADPRRGGYPGRPGYGDQARFAGRADWNRGWRQDGRFDWNGYRQGHRGLFSLPRYAAPRGWDGGYRRFAIGFALEAPLYSSGYWIGDPWAYRLPPAYGELRWVRYYDDALLVDVDTGEVVDTVYGIFY